MAEFDVLPHVIIIFGRPFWSRACKSLRPDGGNRYKHLRLDSFQHTDGPSLHFVNRIRLGNDAGTQETLLIRLRHPSARKSKGSRKWLVEQDDFRKMAAVEGRPRHREQS